MQQPSQYSQFSQFQQKNAFWFYRWPLWVRILLCVFLWAIFIPIALWPKTPGKFRPFLVVGFASLFLIVSIAGNSSPRTVPNSAVAGASEAASSFSSKKSSSSSKSSSQSSSSSSQEQKQQVSQSKSASSSQQIVQQTPKSESVVQNIVEQPSQQTQTETEPVVQETVEEPQPQEVVQEEPKEGTKSVPTEAPYGIVKLSRNGICHDTSSRWYDRTIYFTPYNTIGECIAAGGVLPEK